MNFDFEADPLGLLHQCDGYYGCPKDAGGSRLGPLVGYAGTYGDEGKHYVGDVFYNFAAAESYPEVVHEFAGRMNVKLEDLGITLDLILAAPMGGIILGAAVALETSTRFAFAEKKITAVEAASSREESQLVMGRHTIPAGSRVILVEDVCNNFSTTEKARQLIAKAGAEMVAVCCFLNRSPEVEWSGVPVISLVHVPTAQYEQDDPAVADDIQRGNVVWKPKNEWMRLMQAMEVNS